MPTGEKTAQGVLLLPFTAEGFERWLRGLLSEVVWRDRFPILFSTRAMETAQCWRLHSGGELVSRSPDGINSIETIAAAWSSDHTQASSYFLSQSSSTSSLSRMSISCARD